MITITKEIYICERCNRTYETKTDALICESHPPMIYHGMRIVPGDKVQITKGPVEGKIGIVNYTFTPDGSYGEKYWHSKMIMADVQDSLAGTIGLTYDY